MMMTGRFRGRLERRGAKRKTHDRRREDA